MGWTGIPGASRADLVRDVLRKQTNSEGKTWTHTDYAIKGSVLWSVVEVTDKNGKLTAHYIQCTLIEGDAYKEMSCCEGPYQKSCPKEFLKKVPAHKASSYCANWRAKVESA